LDEVAARAVAARITPAEVEELRELVAEMGRVSKSDDWQSYFPLNIRFHDRVIELAHNSKLLEIYRRVMNELHLARRRSIFEGGGIQVSYVEHSQIVEALESRDIERAAQAARAHVMAGRNRLFSVPSDKTDSDDRPTG
jgi:DNA-binding GntR family transcriptional regulator